METKFKVGDVVYTNTDIDTQITIGKCYTIIAENKSHVVFRDNRGCIRYRDWVHYQLLENNATASELQNDIAALENKLELLKKQLKDIENPKVGNIYKIKNPSSLYYDHEMMLCEIKSRTSSQTNYALVIIKGTQNVGNNWAKPSANIQEVFGHQGIDAFDLVCKAP